MSSSAPAYIYAGLTRWGGGGSQTAKPGTLGGVMRLRLGETEWEHMMIGFPEVVHVHCVTAHPQSRETVFVGTHDGVYRSRDCGATWQRMAFEPRERQIWSICFDPTDHRKMFAGASPTGIFKSVDGGESWSEVTSGAIADRLAMGSFKNRVMRIAVSPSDPKRIIAALEVNGSMGSEDGGETWEDRSDALVRFCDDFSYKSAILTDSELEGMLDAHAICINPTNGQQAIIANRMGLFETTDNGRNWTDLKVGRYSQYTYGRDIRASVPEPGVIYAALSVSSRGDTGSVSRSADGGKTWKRFDHDVVANSTITGIAQHPEKAEIVYFAARHGQVFGTHDAGKTWVTHTLPEGCIGVYALACG